MGTGSGAFAWPTRATADLAPERERAPGPTASRPSRPNVARSLATGRKSLGVRNTNTLTFVCQQEQHERNNLKRLTFQLYLNHRFSKYPREFVCFCTDAPVISSHLLMTYCCMPFAETMASILQWEYISRVVRGTKKMSAENMTHCYGKHRNDSPVLSVTVTVYLENTNISYYAGVIRLNYRPCTCSILLH